MILPLTSQGKKIHNDIIGEMAYYHVNEDDNFYEIARRFDIGIVELLAANPGVDVWQPEPDTELLLPTMHILPKSLRNGIVINLPELRLYYFSSRGQIYTFPIGIGREGWRTPSIKTKIANKRKNPTWIPPISIRAEDPELPKIVPPGPDNPLGDYAMGLNLGSITIHGTNKPHGIGLRSSHGCIRMYPEDIEKLFNMVKVGTPVHIIDQSYKLGWAGNNLYLEISPTQEQSDSISEEYKHPDPLDIPELPDIIRKEIKNRNVEIDWYLVEEAVVNRKGVPVLISTPSNSN